MGLPAPLPCFVIHGLSVNCLAFATIGDKEVFLVGTQDGKCQIYSSETYKKFMDIYVDTEGRSVMSVGFIDDSRVCIHIRSYAVLIVQSADWFETSIPDCKVVSSMKLSHYGFCNSLVVDKGNSFIFPDSEKEEHFLGISSTATAKRISLGTKAAPLTFAHDASNPEQFFIGNDSGLVRRVNWRTSQFEDEIAIADDPIFSIASSSTSLAIGTAKPPIKIRSVTDLSATLVDIHYPAGSSGCGSLCFSKSEKILFAGFWDGSIRGFAMSKKNLGVIIMHLSFHSKSVNALAFSLNERLFAGSSADQKLSVWKLK